MILNKKHLGKVVQLKNSRLNTKIDCIITEIKVNEVSVVYYEKEIEELIYKTLTEEDLIFNDYELKLLS
ncbi:hypothetical protein [Clostridioides sp. ES-S-0001-03]|uniref:hypothetical protein n=1 Tax=Clostridioides sp. ES-S-0001-03 TaxID=2770771 RepID=UPI001D0C6E50|nr:hypothetical protein [Clostridioides sp. ES-S-0001-03]